MARFFIGKLIRLVLLLAAVSVASFALLSISPVDPVRAYIGADMLLIGQEQRDQIAARWGLDQPMIVRYFLWLGQALQGNLGTSQIFNFAVELKIAPVCCAAPPGVLPDQVSIGERLHHLILPALTLSILGVANIALHTRAKLIEVLHSDYALFARAQGERKAGVVIQHGLRNVTLPAITLQFVSLSELFGGSVLAEQVYSYPGLGQATVEAGLRSDVPLLLGIVLFSAVFVFCGNTLADLVYRLTDPRVRLGARS